MIEQAAARYGIDPSVLYGLIEQESGFDPSATSSAGAQGLTQLMPTTAASLGVTEPLDPAQSIEGGARYLSGLLHQFAGNTTDALAAYNAGPGAVQQYGGVPPTRKLSSTSPKCSATPPPTARAGRTRARSPPPLLPSPAPPPRPSPHRPPLRRSYESGRPAADPDRSSWAGTDLQWRSTRRPP